MSEETLLEQQIAAKQRARTPVYLILQKVDAGKYPWGDSSLTYVLMPYDPSPSNLKGDDSLDDEEETGLTNTEEQVIIDKVWTLADLGRLDPLPPPGGLARVVCQGGIARTGSTTGNVYLKTMIFDLGYVNEGGNFTSKASATASLNFSTNSTDYQLCSAQVWVSYDFVVPAGHKFALRTRLKGYRAAGGTESYKMKLCCGRGSFDSFIQF